MTIAPKKRRPDQNTGRRAKVARHVEDHPCEARDGNHLLRSDKNGVTRCCGCRVSWADLDEQLNGERGAVA